MRRLRELEDEDNQDDGEDSGQQSRPVGGAPLDRIVQEDALTERNHTETDRGAQRFHQRRQHLRDVGRKPIEAKVQQNHRPERHGHEERARERGGSIPLMLIFIIDSRLVLVFLVVV